MGRKEEDLPCPNAKVVHTQPRYLGLYRPDGPWGDVANPVYLEHCHV